MGSSEISSSTQSTSRGYLRGVLADAIGRSLGLAGLSGGTFTPATQPPPVGFAYPGQPSLSSSFDSPMDLSVESPDTALKGDPWRNTEIAEGFSTTPIASGTALPIGSAPTSVALPIARTSVSLAPALSALSASIGPEEADLPALPPSLAHQQLTTPLTAQQPHLNQSSHIEPVISPPTTVRPSTGEENSSALQLAERAASPAASALEQSASGDTRRSTSSLADQPAAASAEPVAAVERAIVAIPGRSERRNPVSLIAAVASTPMSANAPQPNVGGLSAPHAIGGQPVTNQTLLADQPAPRTAATGILAIIPPDSPTEGSTGLRASSVNQSQALQGARHEDTTQAVQLSGPTDAAQVAQRLTQPRAKAVRQMVDEQEQPAPDLVAQAPVAIAQAVIGIPGSSERSLGQQTVQAVEPHQHTVATRMVGQLAAQPPDELSASQGEHPQPASTTARHLSANLPLTGISERQPQLAPLAHTLTASVAAQHPVPILPRKQSNVAQPTLERHGEAPAASQQVVAEIEQLRQTTQALTAKLATQQVTSQNTANASQPLVIINQSANSATTAPAFWARSYLGRTGLRVRR